MNGFEIPEPHSPEFKQVRAIFQALLLRGMTPHRTELCIFHCGLQVAGQIDALFLDADWKLVIVDWKRVRNLRTEAYDPLRYPLEQLPDCNYWIYSLQLNLYRYVWRQSTISLYLACTWQSCILSSRPRDSLKYRVLMRRCVRYMSTRLSKGARWRVLCR